MTVNTKYNPDKHHRRSIRLCGYDYAQEGLYFVTICCQDRMCLFGEIVNGEMVLNDAGRMVEKCWLAMPERYQNVILHEYVVMPNHFHAILQIDTVGATLVVAPDEMVVPDETVAPDEMVAPDEIGRPQGSPLRGKTVGQMVGAFKSITTNEYIGGVEKYDWMPFNRKLWQRNYYEHIIRNAESYANIAEYITNNPASWQNDMYY